jgi:hypothetical protein
VRVQRVREHLFRTPNALSLLVLASG